MAAQICAPAIPGSPGADDDQTLGVAGCGFSADLRKRAALRVLARIMEGFRVFGDMLVSLCRYWDFRLSIPGRAHMRGNRAKPGRDMPKRHHACRKHDAARTIAKRLPGPAVCASFPACGPGGGPMAVQDPQYEAKICRSVRMVPGSDFHARRAKAFVVGAMNGWDDGGNGGARCWPTPMRGDLTLMEKGLLLRCAGQCPRQRIAWITGCFPDSRSGIKWGRPTAADRHAQACVIVLALPDMSRRSFAAALERGIRVRDTWCRG